MNKQHWEVIIDVLENEISRNNYMASLYKDSEGKAPYLKNNVKLEAALAFAKENLHV